MAIGWGKWYSIFNLIEERVLQTTERLTNGEPRVPMQVPKSFHKKLKAEAKRQGVTMNAFLARFSDFMFEAANK